MPVRVVGGPSRLGSNVHPFCLLASCAFSRLMPSSPPAPASDARPCRSVSVASGSACGHLCLSVQSAPLLPTRHSAPGESLLRLPLMFPDARPCCLCDADGGGSDASPSSPGESAPEPATSGLPTGFNAFQYGFFGETRAPSGAWPASGVTVLGLSENPKPSCAGQGLACPLLAPSGPL
jgi:hypothetical protein